MKIETEREREKKKEKGHEDRQVERDGEEEDG